jgi:hypothetical protein
MPTNDIYITEDGNRVKLEGARLEAFLAQKAIDDQDAKDIADAEDKAKAELAAKKAIVLDRLGITEEEAKLILG